jgi:pterin-4a-carbinolamine dehydratase
MGMVPRNWTRLIRTKGPQEVCQKSCHRYLSSSPPPSASSEPTATPSSKQPRRAVDPMAKRPNKVCDPYGQGGKPMTLAQAKVLMTTIHQDWRLLDRDESESSSSSSSKSSSPDADMPPHAMAREFVHPDFIAGARFLQSLAAVAQINNHFPSLTLNRRVVRKQWQVYSSIQCHTRVLEGLSTHDFHLAMVRMRAWASHGSLHKSTTLYKCIFSFSLLMSKWNDRRSRHFC